MGHWGSEWWWQDSFYISAHWGLLLTLNLPTAALRRVTTSTGYQSKHFFSQCMPPWHVLTSFLTLLSTQAVNNVTSEFSDYWTVVALWLASDGQSLLFGDKGLQISQRHPIKHLQDERKTWAIPKKVTVLLKLWFSSKCSHLLCWFAQNWTKSVV